jgi:hypothetical protein
MKTTEQTADAILEGLAKGRTRNRGRVTDTPAKVKHKRLPHVVVVRQSAARALEGDSELTEFDKMAQMTLDRSDTRSLPGATVIRPLAADLVRSNARGAQLREQLNFVPIYDPANPRDVVGFFGIFDGEDENGNGVSVGYVLAVYSAAKTTIKVSEDDLVSIDNAFSNAIAQIVHRHKVRNIHIGPFHRLVRHKKAAEQLETNLIENRTVIHCDTGAIDLGTEGGKDAYTLNALIGEKQYVGTVQSLTNGAHSLAEFGKWPKGDTQLPAAGYKFRADNDPTPVPDLNQRDLVRDVITWAADEKLTVREIADLLAEKHGWGSGVARSRNGEKTTVADLRYPEVAVTNLLRKGLALWISGVYDYEVAIPHHLATEKLRTVAQEQIRAAEDEENRGPRRVTYRIDFHHEELPGGEWIEKALIEKALVVRFAPRARKATGRAASRSNRKPLAGVAEWIDGGTQWTISARHAENYIVKNRPAADAFDKNGNRVGWLENERSIEAVLNPAETHLAIAAAAVAHLERGGLSWSRASVSLSGPAGAEQDADRIDTIAEEIAAADKRVSDLEFDYEIARADRLVEVARQRLRELEEARRVVTELHDRIAAAQNALGERRLLDAEAEGNAHGLAATFAALAQVEREAPAALNELLRHTLTDLRAVLVDGGLGVELRFGIRVASTDGPITLGPVTAKVTNRRRAVAEVRHENLVALIFRDGKTVAEAAAEHGYTVIQNAARRVHAELLDAGIIPSREMRAAALDCPVGETKLVIWEAYLAATESRAFKVPAGIDPAFAAHILDVYGAADRRWVRAWANGEHNTARAAVKAAKVSGADGMRWNDLIAILEPNSTPGRLRQVNDELTNGKGANFGGAQRLTFDAILRRSETWHRHSERRVWVKDCPYCGNQTLDHVLRVPEIPGGLLCSTCRHTPSLPTVTFPETYLVEWSGHRGDR